MKRTSETDKDPGAVSVNCSRIFSRIAAMCSARAASVSEQVDIWFPRKRRDGDGRWKMAWVTTTDA